MLRFLGKEENVVRFQRFCGLSWDEKASSGQDWNGEKDEDKNRSKKDNDLGYSSQNSDDGSGSDQEIKDSDSYNKRSEIAYTHIPILHKLFFFGAELGNEIFYITFLPFIYWNVDDYIARRLIMLWVFNMYAGQGLKDVLCWPRPRSPPVLRLETNYAAEFGMPSTHAIAGSIIPFGLVYFSYGRFQVLTYT